MSKLRKILYPLSVLYGELTGIRNKAYDKEVLPVTKFDFPVIAVGNLTTGGTGKTPMVEYLIRLLSPQYKLAVLSRGYKRKTKGFVLADETASAESIGDEPYQYYLKFPEIRVAVDADRVNGIKRLRSMDEPPEVIILDDAFQHRTVKAGLNILLTTYGRLYVDDQPLPAGNLREKRSGAKRAEIIVVTKCPKKLPEKEQFEIAKKLDVDLHQTVFFSKIVYDKEIRSKNKSITVKSLSEYNVLLVTGIANTKPLEAFLNAKQIRFKHMKFPDHHTLDKNDLLKIEKTFEKLEDLKKLILTTEKDYVRTPEFSEKNVYYLAIQNDFIANQPDFNQLITNYVQRDSRNRKLS